MSKSQDDLIHIVEETLKKELHVDPLNVQKTLVDISKWNLRADIDDEINKILDEVRAEMSFSFVLKIIIKLVVISILLFYWVVGIVLAKGVFNTLLCVIPFYAWFLVIQSYILQYG